MGMKAFFKKHFQKIDRVKEEIEQEELWDLSEGNEADEASGDILLNGSLWNKLRQHRRGIRRHWMVILGILGILAAAFFLYLFLHVGTEFTTISKMCIRDRGQTDRKQSENMTGGSYEE